MAISPNGRRQWLAAGRLDEQLQYWKRTLAELDDPIPLPTDRPYPAQLTDAGRLERGRIGDRRHAGS